MTRGAGTTSNLRRPTNTSYMQAALAPVCEALVEAARERGEEERAKAREDARALLAGARARAEHLVEEARAEGAKAADRIGSLEIATARRRAHETVLGAQRRAYEVLRGNAIDALVALSATPEVRTLTYRLEELIGERLGADVPAHVGLADGLVMYAESGNRRCEIGPSMLVDLALQSMPEGVEALWR